MYRYYSIRNVIISIDIYTDLTNHLIEDAIYFANDFDVEKIYFCHVIDPSQYKEKKRNSLGRNYQRTNHKSD